MRSVNPITVTVLALSLATGALAETLRRGTNSDPRSLDPHLALGNSAGAILNDLFEGLTAVGPTGAPAPGAAESWSVSTDGRTYTFMLRQGLVWSDGQPLTAGDFVYSFRRLLDPKTAATFASFLYPIEGARSVNGGAAPPDALAVRSLDDRTVEIKLEHRAPYFPDVLTANAAAPVPRHVVEKNGSGWTEPGVMVSNGAYVLKARVPQTSITLHRNPRYHGAAHVAINTVIYFPGDDPGATLKRFRAGELDIALNFPADQTELLGREFPGALRASPALGVHFVMLNQTRPPLNDVRVRRALSLAIDRDLIVNRLLPPGASPAIGIVPPAVAAYTPLRDDDHALPFAERQRRARTLLAEAGFGTKLPLTFSYKFDSIDQNRRIGAALVAMWREIGVVAQPDSGGAQAIDRDARTENFESIRWTWFAPYNDATSFLSLLAGGEAINRSTFRDEKFDTLLATARELDDPARRQSVLEQAERRAFELQAVVPIYFAGNRRLVNSSVLGWRENPRGINLTRDLSIDGR